MSTGVIIQPPKLQSLRRAKRDEYDLYRTALEWNLTEPIVIETRQDIRSEPQWHESLEPYQHQVSNLITFCRRLPVTLLADDVGLGKTISAGLIISELMSRGRVSKILVVCPKLIMPQWKEELETKFNIRAIVASGKELIDATPPDGRGAVITTYTSARIYLDQVAKNGFDFLVLDEAHKLRNLYGVDPTPQVAQKFRAALKNRVFKYVLMLTATPIQNRLWDMYSLIDLLTAARGHENPFGSTGMFTRRFIADNRQEARRLKSERRDEFRSIVYSHMSRIRRGDANLYFPDRKVQLHRVKPTEGELQLIKLIAEPIQSLNRLAQISIAQALISSPHALAAQLEVMAKNKTIPAELARQIRAITESIKVTAKQAGLVALADQLRSENPEQWRMVVFTTRRETQTSIEAFLSERGVKCGVINGDSGSANQNTVAQFRKSPPDINVVISTEAGSEGVNLQAANVVVNYDLPWNPMIVEQRIGRVQRLASQHATVCVFNVILAGTFEEYIVGRLMEKLQMASHAIGDVDSLLEAAGIDEEEGEGGLEERIRALVISALAGKDVDASVRLAEKNIAEAKAALENEKKDIDELLGGKSTEYEGPRCPKLPPLVRSMELPEFVRRAAVQLGGKLEPSDSGHFHYIMDEKSELVRFEGSVTDQTSKATLFRPGEPAFERLVNRISSTGRHMVKDHDTDTLSRTETVIRNWVGTFDGQLQRFKVTQVTPCFVGTALLRARVTVAHDSLERLVEVPCFSNEANSSSKLNLEALPEFIFDPSIVGVSLDELMTKTGQESGVAEFCRFYSERLIHEMQAAGSNERARKKLEDEFTPRLQVELVGIEGQLFRRVDATVQFTLGTNDQYNNIVSVVPTRMELTDGATLGTCSLTSRSVPLHSLGACAISGKSAIKHLLIKSESSGRYAIGEHVVVCASTGKNLLSDEVQKSEVSGRMVAKSILKTSVVSGKLAEPELFGRCDFTGAVALLIETAVSQVSGKRYRSDQQSRSLVSEKTGHSTEFVLCAETNQPLLASEAEHCEVTGKAVRPGLLVVCASTGKRLHSNEVQKSEVSGRLVWKSILKTSELSGKLAEPELFGRCDFTGAVALLSETTVSQVSGKRYRSDQQSRSVVSGKTGHSTEFMLCAETNQTLLASESERCAITGKAVRAGLLETCEVTGNRVLPSELLRCTATGKQAIKRICVTSSISGTTLIEGVAIRSTAGLFCSPIEAKKCTWTTKQSHPDDTCECNLVGLVFQKDWIEPRGNHFNPIVSLLNGMRIKSDKQELWPDLSALGKRVYGGANCVVEGAELSPAGHHLAVCLKVSTWLGLKVRYAGFIYSIEDNAVVGRVSIGKRENGIWTVDTDIKNAA